MTNQHPPQQPPQYPGYYPPPNWQPIPPQQEGEIDLLEIWRTLVANKKLIIAITFATTFIATIAALVMTPVYRAEVLLAPVGSEKSGGGLSALASQFGGLASMAGISIPSSGNVETSIATLESRQFITRFIKEHNLKPVLFEENWDAEKAQWIDYGPSFLQKLRESLFSKPQLVTNDDEQLLPGEPTAWDSFKLFNQKILSTSQDKKTLLITVNVEWKEPYQAAIWANSLVADVNRELRQRAIDEAEKSIAYLKEQLERTSVADLRSVLFTLIEEHTKNITLAKVNEQYAFRIIDQAVPPQEKAKPKRGLIVVIGFITGLMLAIMLVFARKAIANMQEKAVV